MPTILSSGLGQALGWHEELEREWLYWYDKGGRRYAAPPDVMAQERELRLEMEQRWLAAEQGRLEAEQRLRELLERLEQRGIDPDLL